MAQLRFILENAGLSAAGFSTSTGLNPYFISTPNNFAALDLRAALFFAGPAFNRKRNLLEDRAAAIQRMNEVRFPKRPPAIANLDVQALAHFTPLARCAACHSNAIGYPPEQRIMRDSTAPHIPFNDFYELKKFLRTNPALYQELVFRITDQAGQRMPPQPHEALKADERSALLQLFERARP